MQLSIFSPYIVSRVLNQLVEVGVTVEVEVPSALADMQAAVRCAD